MKWMETMHTSGSIKAWGSIFMTRCIINSKWKSDGARWIKINTSLCRLNVHFTAFKHIMLRWFWFSVCSLFFVHFWTSELYILFVVGHMKHMFIWVEHKFTSHLNNMFFTWTSRFVFFFLHFSSTFSGWFQVFTQSVLHLSNRSGE